MQILLVILRSATADPRSLYNRGNSTNEMDIFHDILSRRLKVREIRRSIGDYLEIVDCQGNFGSPSDGQQVNNLPPIPRGQSICRMIEYKVHTALVEPPRTLTIVIAFSKAWRVNISLGRMFATLSSRISKGTAYRGLISLANNCLMYWPAR